MNRSTPGVGRRPAILFAGLLLLAPAVLRAQGIVFEGELPRTLVFIEEEGRGKVASREMTAFLLEAGFPVIDPALAIDASAQDRNARHRRRPAERWRPLGRPERGTPGGRGRG